MNEETFDQPKDPKLCSGCENWEVTLGRNCDISAYCKKYKFYSYGFCSFGIRPSRCRKNNWKQQERT